MKIFKCDCCGKDVRSNAHLYEPVLRFTYGETTALKAKDWPGACYVSKFRKLHKSGPKSDYCMECSSAIACLHGTIVSCLKRKDGNWLFDPEPIYNLLINANLDREAEEQQKSDYEEEEECEEEEDE